MTKELHQVIRASKIAVSHLLHLIRDKDECRNLLGCGTQSYELLTEAAAALYEKPVDELREYFIPGSAPFHRGGEAAAPDSDSIFGHGPFDDLAFILETVEEAHAAGQMASAVLCLINLSRQAHEMAVELMDSAMDELKIITPDTRFMPTGKPFEAETSAA